MRKIDYHNHTYFSSDSDANPREHILQAIQLQLDEICFTDHYDFEYPHYPFILDVDAYFKEIMVLKEEFKDQIKVKIGIEIGLDVEFYDEINALINKYDFDFVIGSIHVIHQTEFIEEALFFKGKSKAQAHADFFDATLECVEKFDCFNVLGHLDYIVRYGPYDDRSIDYSLHASKITKILETLIQKGKGIEVNTSGYKVHQTHGFPNYDIVKQYYDLGGRIITVGTDAHTSDRVGENVENVINHYKAIGFKDVSTFTKCQKD